ncbi:hypothetical protein B0H13DRAFT_2233283 [Mycena leptocephala]|nr:hypothetical protein B0H13DRAFT_2233283 [Mycena leptocephala]
MFSSLQLFQQLACPDIGKCSRPHCLYSHRTDLPPPPTLVVPVQQPASSSSRIVSPTTIPAKRPATSTSTPGPSTPQEPPRKQQKLTQTRAAPIPSSTSEHALRQEEEIYKKSNKQTYRVAIIQCAAALKRRPAPDTSSHPSVGTEEEVISRAEALKSRKSLRLTRAHLWGFILDIPAGVGGDQPSLEHKLAKCDRCAKSFLVKRKDEAEQCIYHWGKPVTRKVSGQRERVYRCCSRAAPAPDDDGCVRGPHVFYESKPEDLHARHAFSYLKSPPSPSTVLDVAALDCEMIYTTGVFDELVRMDDGVEVIDFNTRFSGITEEEYAKAVLPLSSIRESLDTLINAETVLIGHGLDNDLNTLRIIHHLNVDTSVMFKHSAGPPYRKALKDL